MVVAGWLAVDDVSYLLLVALAKVGCGGGGIVMVASGMAWLFYF